MNTEEGTWPAVRLTERGDVSAVTETLQIEGQMYCCV
jgi:hypothetical protein